MISFQYSFLPRLKSAPRLGGYFSPHSHLTGQSIWLKVSHEPARRDSQEFSLMLLAVVSNIVNFRNGDRYPPL